MKVIHFIAAFFLFLAVGSLSYWIYSANLIHYYYYGSINELYFEPIYSDDEALVKLSVKLKHIYDLVNDEKDFMDKQIESFRNNPDVGRQSNFIDKLNEIKSGDQERINFIKAQLEVMFSFNKYLEEQVRKYSVELDEALDSLRTKSSCDAKKVVICALDVECDFACQIQKLSSCMFLSYFTNRTLLIQPSTDSKTTSLLSYFDAAPIEKCNFDANEVPIIVKEALDLDQSLILDIVKQLKETNNFHGEPVAWYAGHFIKHLTKTVTSQMGDLQSNIKKTRYNSRPYIGYYAKYNSLDTDQQRIDETEKFMSYLNEYYDIYLLKNPDEETRLQRSIYLATDDKFVYNMIKSNYSKVKIMNNLDFDSTPTASKKAVDFATDLHFLAKSDYIICRLSLSMCRLAFEYMQWNSVSDRSKSFRSMDIRYKFNFDAKFYQSVIREQLAADTITESVVAKDFTLKLDYGE